MSHAFFVSEHEDEPVRGLPEELPDGERVLWQGAPGWLTLARRAFHTRKIAVYFGVLLAASLCASLVEGAPAADALGRAGRVAMVGLAAEALLHLLAWLTSRAALYTLTDRRIVLRFGVALTMAVNLPFRMIQSAELKLHADGSGDIPLAIEGSERIGFLLLWPFVRPWRFGARTQPMLRAVPDAERVAALLGRALECSESRGAPTPTRLRLRSEDAAAVAAVAS